jgi:RNA-directed DNA polymerase
MSSRTKKEYKVISLSKKNGRRRKIYCISEEYKAELRKLSPVLCDTLAKNAARSVNYGFRPGHNCTLHAYQHIGYKFTLSLDIENFFDSITPSHVKPYLSNDVIEICFIDGAPRQGLPTSPLISNIAFIECEQHIMDFCSMLSTSIKFTRYADDLVFSFNHKELAEKILIQVELILRQNGFTLNKSKSKLQSTKSGKRIITGVAVNETINVTRRTKKKLRAAIHQKNLSSAKGLIEWSKLKFPKSYQWK